MKKAAALLLLLAPLACSSTPSYNTVESTPADNGQPPHCFAISDKSPGAPPNPLGLYCRDTTTTSGVPR